ncbi:MAG: hypothetical protein KDB37_16725 [Ilumatobacter sp.]|nr:hypothetical protein [Ilumatobacter sp.]
MSTGPDVGRLRNIIVADAVLAFAAGAFTVVMSLTVVRIGWLFAIGAFVVGISVMIAAATIPLRHRNVLAAVLVFAIANWMVAIAAAAVATFAWPLMMLTALLPSIVAASFVTADRLWWFVVPSFFVSLAVVAAGVLQDVTGLSDEVPEWLQTGILIVTTPGFGAVLVFVALQHHFSLTRALDEERAVRQDLAAQTDELIRSRQRVVAATDRERRRIERDLHDGAQSRLVGVNLQLAKARALVRNDPDAADEQLALVRQEVHRAHGELRDLAHGLYPSVLTQHGLAAAIEAAADRSPTPVRLDLRPIGRLPADREAAVYFCLLEALHNANKYAQASRVEIRLRHDDGAVVFEVVDDGIGFDADAAREAGGQGLTNLVDRLGAVSGSLEIEAAPGVGTTIRGAVPLG